MESWLVVDVNSKLLAKLGGLAVGSANVES